MVFSSLQFIFVFLPLSMMGVFFLKENKRNLWIFLVSLGFYFYGSLEHPSYLLLLVCSVIVNFTLGRFMPVFESKKKALLIAGIIYNLAWLFIFKDAYFVLGTKELALPIGISFYTFQSISYLADVYRNPKLVEKSIFNFGMYLTMFPKLTAGPIIQYKDFKSQIWHREVSLSTIDKGLRTFTIGLGLKVLLANQISGLWNDICGVGFESISTPVAWMGIFGYSFQLYFDFWGYSLMAMGLGEMMGFKIPLNFDHPYESLTMTEFWRRWHITLGAWFKNYVYIPLGGNRLGENRTYLNLLAVWLLTGVWHGTGWNFIVWGLALFIIISIEKKWTKKFFEKYRILGHLYMAILIPLSWMIFAIDNIADIKIYISRLFGTSDVVSYIVEGDFAHYLGQYGVLLAVCLIMCTSIPKKIFEKPKNAPLGAVVLLVVFWASVYCIYMGANDPFMYFKF